MLEFIPEEFETADMIVRFRSLAEHIDVLGAFLSADDTLDNDVAMYMHYHRVS